MTLYVGEANCLWLAPKWLKWIPKMAVNQPKIFVLADTFGNNTE